MKRTLILISVAALIVLSFLTGFVAGRKSPVPLSPDTYGDFEAEVTRTRDGDTAIISVNGEEEAVRYLGANTPEIMHPGKNEEECFGKIAAEKNKKLVLGKNLRFERDKKNRDHRGRLLRYVWDGNKMINLELVKEGYAFTEHVSPNYKYRKILEEAALEAERMKKGIWGTCPDLVKFHKKDRKKSKNQLK